MSKIVKVVEGKKWKWVPIVYRSFRFEMSQTRPEFSSPFISQLLFFSLSSSHINYIKERDRIENKQCISSLSFCLLPPVILMSRYFIRTRSRSTSGQFSGPEFVREALLWSLSTEPHVRYRDECKVNAER